MVKPISFALQALLATRQFYVADLYTITLGNNTPHPFDGSLWSFRYCTGDRDITTPDGFKYSSGGESGPYIGTSNNRFKLHQKIGLEVDTFQFDILPGTQPIVGTLRFLDIVRMGIFDGAMIRIDRAFMPKYGDMSAGIVNVFTGRVSQIEAGRSVVTFSVNAWTELLNQQFPRNLFSPSCVNSLGDNSCGVGVPYNTTIPWPQAGCVVGALTGTTYSLSTSPPAMPFNGYWDLGKVAFTTGQNLGIQRTIRGCSAAGANPFFVTLVGDLPFEAQIGDHFTLFAGCNKSFSDQNGCPKFSNTINFRGFPFVPLPVNAV